MFRRVLYILFIGIIAIGCRNAADSAIEVKPLPDANCSVAALRAVAGSGAERLEHDIVVVGRVTSSDDDNNFSRSLVVQDDSGGVEVMVGQYSLSRTYPPGLRVALRLKDCCVGYRYGVMQVGAAADSYDMYDVDYLDSRQAIDRVIVRSADVGDVKPRCVTIAELDKMMCGELITIESVTLAESITADYETESIEDARWSGYTLFKDECGDSVAVYTRKYANYACDKVIKERVALTGILQWGKYANGKECYQLKMRYAEDCVAR